MEFVDPGPVTLLHFTPLCTDNYSSHSYGRCLETFSSTAPGCSLAAQQGPPPPVSGADTMSMETGNPAAQMNCSLRQSPYNYIGSSSYEAYAGLSMEQNATYCTQQEQMQTSHPPPPASHAAMAQDYGTEFGMLMGSSNDPGISEVGPPPVRLPRLEIPVSVETTSVESKYSCSRNGPFYTTSPHSTPHSPMSVGGNSSFHHRRSYGISKTHTKTRTKSSRSNMVMRATSPIFPDQSTPLFSLKRQPSVSSITSNRSIDQLSTFSVSVKSDPGIYNLQTSSTCESTVNSPSLNSTGSPGFEFSSATSGSQGTTCSGLEGSSLSCLKLEMPAKYARRISELDRKILKLQAERSKVLEKAHRGTDLDAWLITEKPPEVGKAYLYIYPLGIHELDEPLYDDANKLLRKVGGLYLDLHTSISVLRSICYKGVSVQGEISTCFVYIQSLLHKNQKLKLSNLQGVYSIQVDVEDGLTDGVLPIQFSEALSAANKVLKCAQHITLSYINVQMQLQKLRQVAAGKVDDCDAICQKLGLVERSQLRAVLEGNCTTMASAERVWPQYYQVATETIKSITECIHPSNCHNGTLDQPKL